MREIDRFIAESADGQRYTVLHLAHQVPFRDNKRNERMLDGARVFQLLDGRHVNFEEAGVFQIFDTEERIWKVED